ncbi:MAG: DASS family sodium-coupled anion symporter [Desulfobacteraceae bacterium]|jgi:sodium-dependent dicarboxylate transporter 2/3/5
MIAITKSKNAQILFALLIGFIIFVLPKPEATQFKISGDVGQTFYKAIRDNVKLLPTTIKNEHSYVVEAKKNSKARPLGAYLETKAASLNNPDLQISYVDGLSPKAVRFLAILVALLFLFIVEPIPLEITAILIGVSLVLFQIVELKDAWAAYMHPVVVFIMCCLIFAIALDKAGLTKRLGHFIVQKAGTNVVRFTFFISIGLGISSAFMHDAAAVSIGIVTMLPLMKAAGIKPHSNTAKFMLISLAFACSCGGMGSLIGGGRCMVSAAFLKEFTGIEITFMDWIKFAMPMAIATVPAAVLICYFVFKPDKTLELPSLDEELSPWSFKEKTTLIIIVLAFIAWLTKSIHGMDYSVTGMLAVAALVLTGILKWDDIHEHLEWGTALFIFGGGISLGLAMGYSGAADYFANLFFPLVKGGGWLLLFAGVAIFGALVTNAMANVAAAALILPIVIPIAQLEGVDPRVLALCLGTATSFAMLLVIGCPPNAIAYSFRMFKSSDITRVGLVATPILIFILLVVAALWWNILGLI